MRAHAPIAPQDGQSTVEWTALILLVSLALGVLAAVVGLPGAALARGIAESLVCAARLGACGTGGASDASSPLARAYGEEIAALASEHAPTILYERGMRALPVDYRRCREDACADGSERGGVWESDAGRRTVAFVHAIDCRAGGARCAGERAGNLYLQYWLYYPGSATAEGSIAPGLIREISGGRTHHADDWESYAVRLGPGGAYQRASAHHGYGRGWIPEHGLLYVAGGSHAGSVEVRDTDRATPSDRLALIPLGPIAAAEPSVEFAVTPPWLKRVWLDPEYGGTD